MDEKNKDHVSGTEKMLAFLTLSSILIIVGLILFFCYSCTNVVMTHTEGSASDTVEDAQHVNPNVSPSVTIPKV